MIKLISTIFKIILIAIILVSCDFERANQELEQLEVDFSLAEEKSASDFFSKIEYIPISVELNEFIGQVSKIITTKDRLYLLDEDYSSSVFVLNHEGELISAIYPEGDGPSEFNQLDDISFDFERNHLLLYASDDAKVLKFTADGDYLSQQKKFIYSEDFVSLSNDGKLVFYTANQMYEDRPFKVLYFDSTFQVVDEYLKIEEPLDGIYHGLLSHFSNYDRKHYLFVDSFNDTIYSTSSKGTSPSIILDFMSHKLKASDIESKENSMELLTYIGEHDKAFIYGNILHNEDWLFLLVNKGRNVYQMIHDKKNDSTHIANKLIDDMTDLIIFPFYDLYEGELISFVDREYLAMQKQMYQANGESIPRILEKILSTKHNFYLAKYKLKKIK